MSHRRPRALYKVPTKGESDRESTGGGTDEKRNGSLREKVLVFALTALPPKSRPLDGNAHRAANAGVTLNSANTQNLEGHSFSKLFYFLPHVFVWKNSQDTL